MTYETVNELCGRAVDGWGHGWTFGPLEMGHGSWMYGVWSFCFLLSFSRSAEVSPQSICFISVNNSSTSALRTQETPGRQTNTSLCPQARRCPRTVVQVCLPRCSAPAVICFGEQTSPFHPECRLLSIEISILLSLVDHGFLRKELATASESRLSKKGKDLSLLVPCPIFPLLQIPRSFLSTLTLRPETLRLIETLEYHYEFTPIRLTSPLFCFEATRLRINNKSPTRHTTWLVPEPWVRIRPPSNPDRTCSHPFPYPAPTATRCALACAWPG
jgi:hypothetical protein